ncbi:MAG: hypothetical protein ACTSUT_03130 [Promethearchaeota archaeon]
MVQKNGINQLAMTIRTIWLEKIVSGEKKEEQRESKLFYHRLFKNPKNGIGLNKKSFIINPPKTILFRAGYLKTKEHTIKSKNGVFFESPINKSKKYAVVEVESIRYEQFMGLTKPIPEGFVKGDISYVIYIKSILEHNL